MKWHAVIVACLLATFTPPAHSVEQTAQGLYNQGNAHARAQEWGLAVVDYQRARLLAPEDRDIEANLQLVLTAARVPVATPTFTARLTRFTSPDIAAALGVLGLLLLGTSLLLRPRAPRIATLLVGAPLLAFSVGHALGLRPLLHSAVVVGGPATAQASPVPMADALFALPEASTVDIVAARPDYVLVSAPTGARGWVARARLVALLPEEP